MEIIEITKQNTGFMKGFIDEDMLENIGRIFYRGLAVVDEDEIRCAMIWEVLNLENNRSNESRICFFKARDEEAASGILDAYDMKVMAEDIRVSSVVMPVENRRADAYGKRSDHTQSVRTSGTVYHEVKGHPGQYPYSPRHIGRTVQERNIKVFKKR